MRYFWIGLRSLLNFALLLCLSTEAGSQAKIAAQQGDTLEIGEDCNCGDNPAGDLFGNGETGTKGAEQVLLPRTGADGKVAMDLFVMSLCPYGMAAEQMILPLAERFAAQVDLKIYFIADEKEQGMAAVAPPPRDAPDRPGCAASRTSGDGPFLSLHGQEEIDEGRRQLIVRADYPEHYYTYLLCRNNHGPEGDWAACASAAGIDPDRLQIEALGARGKNLFRENIRLANALDINLSPTLLINGEEFAGDFDPFSLGRRICSQDPNHASCRDIPACGRDEDCGSFADVVGLCIGPDTPWARCEYRKPTTFKLTVLDTEQCPACNSNPFLHSTTDLFPGVQVEKASLETADGKELARRYDIQVFPAYIFATEFARSPRFERVRHMVVKKNGNYLLVPRILTTTYWWERHPQPGRLDLFVPGWTPEAEDEILRLWPRGRANIRVHHLWLPGAVDEVPEEQARRACLATHQPEHYPAYASARNKTLRAPGPHSWQEIARAAGVDLQALQICVESGRGRDLAGAAQNLADTLQLAPATTSALIGNQVLIRHAQPGEVFRLWQEGNQL